MDIILASESKYKKKLLLTFKKYKPIAVIHLAAKSVVHELEKNQKDCFEVNVNGPIGVNHSTPTPVDDLI